jgi:hydroxyacylglutathione hydrolase
MGLFFYRHVVKGLSAYSYLVGDEEARICVAIDPQRDVQPYLDVLKNSKMRLTHILETHVHADFVSGSRELKHALGDNPLICCSGNGGQEWIPHYVDQVIENGDEISVGEFSLKALHTPGHTPEHLSWSLSKIDEETRCLFTGDCLFVGSVGRPDLIKAESTQHMASQLYHSLFETLTLFADSVEIFPAHGAGSLCGKEIKSYPSSTLGVERQTNPYLKAMSKEKWIENLLQDMPQPPPYFHLMKEINVQGPEIMDDNIPGIQAISPEGAAVMLSNNVAVLDLRSKEEFAHEHIPGAINIPMGPQMVHWAGWVVPYDEALLLVLDSKTDLKEVIESLLRIGLEDIVGYIEDGMSGWEQAGLPLSHLETCSVQQLDKNLENSSESILVVDVRTNNEWNAGHIEGAVHMELNHVPQKFNELPRDIPLFMICGSGYRSSIASSLLQREGFENVHNVQGGMTAWKQALFHIHH